MLSHYEEERGIKKTDREDPYGNIFASIRKQARRYAETLDLIYSDLSQRTPCKILDLGTGSGLFPVLIKKTFPRHNLVASDPRCDVHKLRARLEPIGIQVEEKGFKGGAPLPFADESFDVCLLLEVFEHLLGDPMYVLSELYRILTYQGILLLTTPNLAHIHKRIMLLVGKQPQLYTYIDCSGHFREWTMDEVAGMLCNTGFDIVEKRYFSVVGCGGRTHESLLLRFLYYPYNALVTIRPSLMSNIAVLAQKLQITKTYGISA